MHRNRTIHVQVTVKDVVACFLRQCISISYSLRYVRTLFYICDSHCNNLVTALQNSATLAATAMHLQKYIVYVHVATTGCC